MADSEIAIANLALLKIGVTGGLIGSFDDPSLEAQVCKLEYAQTRDELFGIFKWPRATRRAYPAQLGGALYAPATPYAPGAFVSYAPARANVVNMPESTTTFVYVSLVANNIGNQPDTSPTSWRQLSRAAWKYVFQLPGDLIEVQGLYRYGRNPREDQQVPYALENDPTLGTILLTDAGLPYDTGTSSVPQAIELVYTAQVTDPKQFPPIFTKALYWALAVKLALEIRKDPDEAAKAAVQAEAAKNEAIAAAKREIRKDPEPIPSFIAARGSRRRGHR